MSKHRINPACAVVWKAGVREDGTGGRWTVFYRDTLAEAEWLPQSQWFPCHRSALAFAIKVAQR